MSLPGPGFVPWAIALAAWAAGFAVAGELLRRIASRYAPAARTLRPVELVVVDLYLGGGVLFVIAVVPFGLFYPFAPALVIALAVAALAGWFVADRRRGRAWDLRKTVAAFRAPPVLVALGAALALFLVELWTATSVPTGNTFDSSMLTYYVGHLETYRTVPFNFLPATPFANPYPQGTTAWIAAYQGSFGLPPARASLLVTPLFLGLAPLGAYAVGDRLLGTPLAGATFAVAFAFVGSWTRVLVGGSNDFVLALPLVLVLFARVGVWTGRTPLSWGDALGFGALVGVGVSLNPAGPIWLLLTILFLGVAAGPRSLGRLAAWFGRWLLALGTGVVFALPSLAEEVTGPGGLFHRGLVAGSVASPGVPGGISVAQFFGLADPFLFRGTDVWLSPFPLLRDELAVLIAVGAAVLLYPRWIPGFTAESREFGRSVLAGGAVAFGILLAGVAVDTGATGLGPFLGLTSFAETSILLFTIYTMVAAVPAYLLLRHADRRLRALRPEDRTAGPAPGTAARSRVRSADPRASIGIALGVAFLLFVPGLAGTFAELPEYETTLYHAFGNVSQGDFDLLEWAPAHLPAGARVLVAPGSAAGFLPGYDPSAVVLFPMIDGVYVNASYQLLVRELANGTLDPSGVRALNALSVGFVAVTGATSQLFRPFAPAPFLGDPISPILFHEGDAYLFAWDPGTAPAG